MKADFYYRSNGMPVAHIRLTFSVDRDTIEAAMLHTLARVDDAWATAQEMTRAQADEAVRREVESYGHRVIELAWDLRSITAEQMEALMERLYPEFCVPHPAWVASRQ